MHGPGCVWSREHVVKVLVTNDYTRQSPLLAAPTAYCSTQKPAACRGMLNSWLCWPSSEDTKDDAVLGIEQCTGCADMDSAQERRTVRACMPTGLKGKDVSGRIVQRMMGLAACLWHQPTWVTLSWSEF